MLPSARHISSPPDSTRGTIAQLFHIDEYWAGSSAAEQGRADGDPELFNDLKLVAGAAEQDA